MVFLYSHAVNRTRFSAQLAYRQETWFKCYFCVWLSYAWFEQKRIIHCHVQVYTPTFRNRKSRQKIFAAQTPQRKRGFLSTRQTIVGKVSQHLQNSLSSLADAPHCSMMGSVQILTLAKARAIFYIVLQSTGLAFLPSLPNGKKLGSNSTFMFNKKLCAKLNLTHRVIFLLNYPLYLVAIVYFGTCSDLSQPPAFWWLTV